jgi:hypothetical protein
MKRIFDGAMVVLAYLIAFVFGLGIVITCVVVWAKFVNWIWSW